MSYRVTSVPEDIARAVRQTRRSPHYGHPAREEIARGYGPCRCCLRTFSAGRDQRLLFTYNPFDSGTPAPGPVFIHAEACTAYAAPGFPPELRALPLLFEAHDATGMPRERMRPQGSLDATIAGLLARTEIARIVVRNAEAGCFIARVERTATR